MTRKIFFQDKNVRIYVDTNVLRNYCTNQEKDCATLKYLFSKRDKKTLFTSTLAIAQTLSAIQKKFGKEESLKKGYYFSTKFTFLDFEEKDVMNSFEKSGDDIEDNMQYVISQKVGCGIIISNDKSGFLKFPNVFVLKPTKKKKTISSYIA